jgi:DNA-binding NarL/FixJ family response regulator
MNVLERLGLTRDEVMRQLSGKPASNEQPKAGGSTQDAVWRLHDFGLKDSQIARQLRITTETVSRLLKHKP